MNKLTLTLSSLAVAGLASGALGLAATANAAPTGPDSAQDTINSLRSDGYQVIVHNTGDTPLDQATVTSVLPINSTYWVWDNQHDNRHPETGAHTYVVNVA